MAYESINVYQLKDAINRCKQTLNHSITDSLKDSIMNDDVWHNDTRDSLRKYLDRFGSLYSDIENTLNSYMSIANEIEKYKNLQAENSSLSNECNQLEGRLYYNETYYEEHEDPKTKKTVREYKTRRVKDQNVQNSINNKRNKIGSNNSEMNRIVDRLRNSI